MTTRRAIDLPIELGGNDAGAALLERVLRSLPTTDEPARATLALHLSNDGNTAQADLDHRTISSGPADRVLSETITAVNVRAIASVDVPVIHASVVCTTDQAIVIPGNPGTGKSTLAAILTDRGFSYSSDEAAPLAPHGMVVPYTKPIVLGRGSFRSLRSLPDEATVLGTDQVRIVDASILRGGVHERPARLRLVVLPRFREHARLEVRELSRAEIVAALASNLFNAREERQRTLDYLEHITRPVRGIELVYGDGDDAAAALRFEIER